ncbi:MAG: iron-sulfur protein [Eubacteriales bacterium]
MKIAVINGSPKGKNSITVHTPLYLEKRHPEHSFTFFHAAQRIRSLEKDFTDAKNILSEADLILFAYPIYTFLAPYQLHRFIELLKENDINLSNKYVSQITTSKHFYDITAHKYVEENCYDLGMRYLPGFSADMDDLQKEKGQREADCYFEKMIFDIENGIFKERLSTSPLATSSEKEQAKSIKLCYAASIPSIPKIDEKNIVIVTNVAENDSNLQNMIADFEASIPHKTTIKNLRDFKFTGGCIGCLNCSTTAKCIYNDGFEDYLRNEIQTADAIVYAFTIENHYTHSSFKCYDDRQFCNGHRTVTTGMPVGYIISGDYQNEHNIQVLVEARSEVGGVYLSGVATDEGDTKNSILQLSASLDYALNHVIEKPNNFYAVGGSKIFRDLVYLMQGMMKADHKFYKEHGIYDFPHNQKGRILMMKVLGSLMNMPSVQKKMKGKISEFIIAPYEKVIENAKRIE